MKCPNCKSSDVDENFGYETITDSEGNIEDCIDVAKCNNCGEFFPSVNLIYEE